MCEGFILGEQEEWKRVRASSWVTMCSFSDPKKLPSSMYKWWPIGEESQPQRQFDKEEILKTINKEKGIK